MIPMVTPKSCYLGQPHKLYRSAGAGSMAIFHHDPDHKDDFMDKLETEARGEWNNVFAAREQMEVELA